MSNVIDFTKMRLHKRTRGTATIEKCLKCGRKGERSQFPMRKDGRPGALRFVHAGKVVGAAGMAFFEVTDSCFCVQEPAKEPEPAVVA